MIKIHPPILVLILVSSNYFSSQKIDLIHLPNQDLISIIILLIGILILINPIFKFIKSKTTIDPIKFKKVNKLIISGIYKYSRNPMYLGLLIIVISTSIFFLNIFSITTPLLFYCWINRFQIKREEIFLTEKFGEEYISYKIKTRRWIQFFIVLPRLSNKSNEYFIAAKHTVTHSFLLFLLFASSIGFAQSSGITYQAVIYI